MSQKEGRSSVNVMPKESTAADLTVASSIPTKDASLDTEMVV